MKRKAILIAALTLVIALAFMGTLAYFTAQDEADNTITLGNVEIKIHEKDAQGFDWVDQEDVMPGTKVDKVVTVENTGSSPVWVRVQLTPSLDPDDITGWENLITVTTVSTGWTLNGGYYYYDSELAPGATTSAVVSAVDFDPTMGNDYQGAVYNLNVAAEAVQSENNGSTAVGASGW